ncbi:MAG: hypothetical protein AB7P23_12525 [Amphiplicatus sp.]
MPSWRDSGGENATPPASGASDAELIAYIGDMAQEMAGLARRRGFAQLSALLACATEEARKTAAEAE